MSYQIKFTNSTMESHTFTNYGTQISNRFVLGSTGVACLNRYHTLHGCFPSRRSACWGSVCVHRKLSSLEDRRIFPKSRKEQQYKRGLNTRHFGPAIWALKPPPTRLLMERKYLQNVKESTMASTVGSLKKSRWRPWPPSWHCRFGQPMQEWTSNRRLKLWE